MFDLLVCTLSAGMKAAVVAAILGALLVLQSGDHAGSPDDDPVATHIDFREPIYDVIPMNGPDNFLLVLRNGMVDAKRLDQLVELDTPQDPPIPDELKVIRGLRCEATGNLICGGEDGSVRVGRAYDSASWRELGRLSGLILSLDVSADGKHLCAGSSDGDIGVWNLESGTGTTFRTRENGAATYVEFVGDSTEVAARTLAGPTGIYDGLTGRKKRDWRVPVEYLYDHDGLDYGSGLVCTGRVKQDAHVMLMDSQSDEILWDTSLPSTDDTQCLGVKLDVSISERLVVVGCGGSLWQLDLASGEILREGFVESHKITGVFALSDARTVLSAGTDGVLQEWELQSLTPRRFTRSRPVTKH